MKKMTTAILLFDLMAGMLFLGFYGLGSRAVATDSGIVQVEGEQRLEEADVKKIAIPFDGECIIRLSQENCLIQAVSIC